MKIGGQVEKKSLINIHMVELQCKLILCKHSRLRKASLWNLQCFRHQSNLRDRTGKKPVLVDMVSSGTV